MSASAVLSHSFLLLFVNCYSFDSAMKKLHSFNEIGKNAIRKNPHRRTVLLYDNWAKLQ